MRLFRFSSVLVVLLLTANLSAACGNPDLPPKPEIVVQEKAHLQQAKFPNALAAADLAIGLQQDTYAFAVAVSHAREQPLAPTVEPDPVVTNNPPVVSVATDTATPPSTGGPWLCILQAETGGVPAMGPTYWTEFGVIKDVIEDYGTPEEQAAIFSGTAGFDTRFAVVARFADENGFGGWGSLTRSKCGL